MLTAPDERRFFNHGKSFGALLNEQTDGRLSVTVRLPDGKLRTVPGERFAREDEALAAAEAFVGQLVANARIGPVLRVVPPLRNRPHAVSAAIQLPAHKALDVPAATD